MEHLATRKLAHIEARLESLRDALTDVLTELQAIVEQAQFENAQASPPKPQIRDEKDFKDYRPEPKPEYDYHGAERVERKPGN